MINVVPWLRDYDRSWLGRDVVGGITAGTVVVPQAMAYATVAGLPVQVGLYTCMVPTVVYAGLGGSRTLSVSTTSTVAALTASSLVAAGVAVDTDGSPGALAALTILVGLILLAARLLRLGGLIDNISDATLNGIKVGVGATVAVGQLPKVLGITPDSSTGGFFPQLVGVLGSLPDAGPVTVAFSAVTLAVLVVLRRLAPQVPAPLVAVVGGIVAVAVFGLDQHGLAVVGHVPRGLPVPVLPSVTALSGLLPGAFAIAIMVFLETAAVAATVRRAGEPPIDNDVELTAIGVANVLGGFGRAMPAAGGFSQTAINQRAGARTQLSELVTAALAVSCALFLGGVLELLPQATLACLVIIAVTGLISVKAFMRLWRIGRVEFWCAVLTGAFALVKGMLAAVLVGVVLTLLLVLRELNRTTVIELQPTLDDDLRPPHEEQTAPEPALLVLRPEGQLYTANIKSVIRQIMARADHEDLDVVVLDLSAVPWLSVMVADQLLELSHRLGRRGVDLWIAALTPRALETARQFPRWSALESSGRLFPTALSAVRAHRRGSTGAASDG